VNPDFILANPHFLSFIETGKAQLMNQGNPLQYSDEILPTLSQAILLTDRNLNIIDYNGIFFDLIRSTDDILSHSKFSDFFIDTAERTLSSLLHKIQSVLSGITPPQFSITCVLLTKIEKTLQINFDVIFMTSQRAALIGEHKRIETIIFLIEDNSESRQQEKHIIDEQQKISNMLEKVIPSQVVNQLNEESGSLSFVVNSATAASN
jgi:PAS domain-containing protein